MDPNNGHQVVHVRGDSDTDLEELFRAVMNPTKDTIPPPSTQVPLRLRKLPPSFFKEPDKPMKPPSASHSRESSADSNNAGGPFATQSLGLPLHPRAHSSPASLQQMHAAASQQTVSSHARQHSSYDVSIDDLPFPPGWEEARTPSGQRYFLNHIDQTTTWTDPRKNYTTTQIAQLQHALLQQQQQQQQQQHQQQQQQQQQVQQQSGQDIGTLPQGWEQASTPEGETYFINHLDRSTSWLDPRIAMRTTGQNVALPPPPPHRTQQQQQQQQQQALQGQQQGPLSPQQLQQKLRLQKLQLEREQLRRRQLEIQQQEVQLRKEIQDDGPTANSSQSAPQNSEMTSVSTTGIDPFLGGTGGTCHSRDESGDSGLGMSSNYSLPRTPDDMLSNVDEMDTSDAAERKTEGAAGSSSQTPMADYMEAMQGTNVDLIDSSGETGVSNLEGEDLVPSLQEALSSDILNDVEAVLSPHKIDNFLTWL